MMILTIDPARVRGLGDRERAVLANLLHIWERNRSANDTKRKYYEGKISLSSVNLGLALPDGMQRLDGKTTRIIPEFSVIGQLFKPRITDTRIVRSTASGIQQHGLATWGIDHGKLAYANENDSLSKWINETLALWIGDITQEERPVFVDELFDALSAGGATNFNEFGKDGTEGLEAVLKQFRNSSEMTRKTISDLPKQAFRLGIDQLRQRIEDSVQKL